MKIFPLLSLALLCLSCTAQQDALDDGKFFSFDNQSADWVIVNYWAEWCAPCRKEIPELNELTPSLVGDLIERHPILMERPVVMTEQKAVICRPPIKVFDLL